MHLRSRGSTLLSLEERVCPVSTLSCHPLQKITVDDVSGSTDTYDPQGVSGGILSGGVLSGGGGSVDWSLCPLQRSAGAVENLWDDHDALLSPVTTKAHGGGSLGGRHRSLLAGDGGDEADSDGDGGSHGGEDIDDASLAYTPISASSSSINR